MNFSITHSKDVLTHTTLWNEQTTMRYPRGQTAFFKQYEQSKSNIPDDILLNFLLKVCLLAFFLKVKKPNICPRKEVVLDCMNVFVWWMAVRLMLLLSVCHQLCQIQYAHATARTLQKNTALAVKTMVEAIQDTDISFYLKLRHE